MTNKAFCMGAAYVAVLAFLTRMVGLTGEHPSATLDSAPTISEPVYPVPVRHTTRPCRLVVVDTSGWIVTRVEGARLEMRLPPDVKNTSAGERFFVGTTPEDQQSAASALAGWDFESNDRSLRFSLHRRPGPPGRVLPEPGFKDFEQCTHAIGGRKVIVFSYLRLTANPQEQRHETYVVTGGIPIDPESTVTFLLFADSQLSRQRGLAIVGTIRLTTP